MFQRIKPSHSYRTLLYGGIRLTFLPEKENQTKKDGKFKKKCRDRTLNPCLFRPVPEASAIDQLSHVDFWKFKNAIKFEIGAYFDIRLVLLLLLRLLLLV